MKVSYNDLEEAFSFSGDEIYYWVDKKKTGRVILIGDEAFVGEVDYENEEEAEAVRQILMMGGEIEIEDGIEIDEDRFVEVVPPESGEKWKWMEEFTISQVNNKELENRLVKALRGGKPFRRFKDILMNHPQEAQNWFDFENKKLREYIEDWAESEEILIDFADREK